MKKGYGYRPSEREKSELENQLGVSIVDLDADPFPTYRGKLVRIGTSSASYAGTYQGTTEYGFAVLMPHLNSEVIFDENGNSKKIYNWSELPDQIRAEAILTFGYQDKKYLDDLIEVSQRALGIPQKTDKKD